MRAEGWQEENKKETDDRAAEIRSLYQGVFDTDEGQLLLTELIDTYLTREMQGKMTPEDIMYQEGQNSVIRRIVRLSQRLEHV